MLDSLSLPIYPYQILPNWQFWYFKMPKLSGAWTDHNLYQRCSKTLILALWRNENYFISQPFKLQYLEPIQSVSQLHLLYAFYILRKFVTYFNFFLNSFWLLGFSFFIKKIFRLPTIHKLHSTGYLRSVDLWV